MCSTPRQVPPAIVLSPYVEESVLAAQSAAAAEAKAKAAAEAPVQEAVIVKMNPVDLEKGKQIYISTCIRCHNKDPNIKGSIGPELTDAPLEVMQHKVASGRYPDVLPEGFVPKRKTKLMTKFTQHIPDVPSIHAYIQSMKR